MAKQLETKLQNERNDKEYHLQQAVVERELTKVAELALLEKEKTPERRATADLNVTKAKAEAQKIILDARIEGLKQFETAGFTGQGDLLNLDHVGRAPNNRTALGVTTSMDQSGGEATA